VTREIGIGHTRSYKSRIRQWVHFQMALPPCAIDSSPAIPPLASGSERAISITIAKWNFCPYSAIVRYSAWITGPAIKWAISAIPDAIHRNDHSGRPPPATTASAYRPFRSIKIVSKVRYSIARYFYTIFNAHGTFCVQE
jgi:hypothetical protein